MLNYRSVNIIFLTLVVVLVCIKLYMPVPAVIFIALLIIYIAIQTYGAMIVSSQFFIPVRCQGDRNGNSVAITFDDGPLPFMTEQVLEILKTYQAPAAFFCIGHRAEKNPDIVRKISEGGHLVGNHSYLHGKLFDLQTQKKITAELEKTDRIIGDVIGRRPRFFRPPYGVTNPNVARAIRRCGHLAVGWNVRSLDTVTKDEAVLYERVTKNLQGGDIVLFHDYCELTIRVLPRVLEHINQMGLKVVRLDELLNEKAYV